MASSHIVRKTQKIMVTPINVIFRHLQHRTKVSVCLYGSNIVTIEGVIIGFDEFMNMVLDGAEEVITKKDKEEQRKSVGCILLKGDCISWIKPVLPAAPVLQGE